MKTKSAAKQVKPAKKSPAAAKTAKVTKPVKSAKESKPSVAKPQAKDKSVSAIASDKQKVIESFAQKKGDTGSPEVQVALLTFKIEKLSQHLNGNQKDNHSRRGLLKVVAKRRRIINYLQKLDNNRYKHLIEQLGLKK